MPRRLTSLLLAGGLALGSCRDIEQTFLADDTPIDPCDPTSSTYHGYAHFIERDFLTKDGNLDYRKWFEKSRVEASECDPLKARDRAANRIERLPASGVAPVAPGPEPSRAVSGTTEDAPAPAPTPVP